MRYTPLVSVIIPNYCHSKYLDERITTVLNQTYKNFEVIILDDCSPDNGASRAVIEKYRNIPQVTHIVYNTENSGSTFKQWSLGVSLAKGSLIWIAESDDSCSPVLLESLVNEFAKYPNNVISYSTSCHYDEMGNITMRPLTRNNKHYDGKLFIKYKMVTGNIIQNASSCLFSKEAALSISPNYTKYKGAGDRLFWIFIAEKGEVSVVNKGLNYFRKHSTNVTSKCYSNGRNYIEDKEIFDLLKQKGYVTYFYGCLTKWYVNTSINLVKFDSDDIKRRVANLWNIDIVDTIIGSIFHKILKLTSIIDFLLHYLFSNK